MTDTETTSRDWTPIEGEYRALPARGITKETCEHWDYQVGEYQGKNCHIANVRDPSGEPIAQKLRMPGKEFPTLGNGKGMPLYGQWLCPPKGKHIVITEGELDALSMSQAFDLKWPVVSLPNGAPHAAKAIANAYEFLDGFDRIVLMFDMDTPGQEAAQEVAALLPPGKVCIASLKEKDANDVLQQHGPGALVRAFWDAPVWRPDGIRKVSDVREAFFNPPPISGIPYPWPEWNEVLGMMRLGTFVTFTAGTGVGKSTGLRELLHHALITHNEPCGALFMEESNVETMEYLVGIQLSKNISMDRTLASPEEIATAFDTIEAAPLYLYDHFGSSDVDNICNKIRYLVKACGVRWIFLDHISIMVSGLEGDERRTIDMAMTKLRTLVSELGCTIFAVVHLRKPQGDLGHEDGAQVSLGQLRGSHSIAQLSNVVVAFNKPEDDPNGPNVHPVCLKNRNHGGKKGPMGTLTYDRMTGRLSDCVF